MSFPRYPSYKDSGVALLGEVPAHWPLKRFKHMFKERAERSVNGEELLLSVSAYTGVSPRSEVIDEGDHLSRADSLEGYKVCYKDDLVVNIMLAWNRGLAFTAHQGIVSPAYCVYFVIDGSDPRFLNYLVRSNEYTLYFKAFSSGVIDSRLRIYPETFGRLFCGVPPLAEQTAIAEFLDRETGKIDELVAEQRRLMELLKEKRQAVISHAVTRGLNPAAPLKPSGIEWLGDIPAHWEVLRLRNISPRISGRLVYQPAQYFASEGVPFLMGNNVTECGIDWNNAKLIPEAINREFAQHALHEGDVITVRVGAPGLTCVVPKEADGLNCGSLMIIRRAQSFDSDWLSRVMNSAVVRTQIAGVQYGAAQEQINITDAVNFLIPTPPLIEQRSVVSFLATETAKFDTLTAEAQRAIELLQERRTALISAAVTGQIDVRNSVAPGSTNAVRSRDE